MSVPDPATTDWVPLWSLGGSVGALPSDTLIPAATRIISNKILAADAQPIWRVMGDGRQDWGPGGSTAPDVSLYRSATGTLTGILTNLSLIIGLMTLRIDNLGIQEFWGAEANPRVRLSRDAWGPGIAGLQFGPGGAAAIDTTLYRSAAGELRTPGSFVVGGRIWTGGASTGGVWVDGGASANPQFVGSYDAQNIGIHLGSWKQLFRYDGYWNVGAFNDTWVYRGAANNLYVLYTIRAAQSIVLGNDGTLSYLYFQSSLDAYMWRRGAGSIQTNGNFTAGGPLYANVDQAVQTQMGNFRGVSELMFGNANDASIYRESAHVINNYSVDGAWGTFRAAAFSVQSDRKTKSEIEPVAVPVEQLLKAGIYKYKREKLEGRHLGLVADELPDELLSEGSNTEGNILQFVDLYKLATALLATVQHLDERLKTLEGSA